MTERFLVVKQPWASLIMAGKKDVENRSWPVPSTLPQWYRCDRSHGRRPTREPKTLRECDTPDGPFPFRLWIHAGKEYDDCAPAWVEAEYERLAWARPDLYAVCPTGVLLGSVTVTGCHHADECRTDAGMRLGPYCAGFASSPRQPCVLLPDHNGPCYGRDDVGTNWRHCSPWAQEDVFHWTLTDPVALPEPIPMRGYQGLPFLPDDVLAEARRQLAEAESVTA